ncbi:MAG: cyclic nucleotide-binding domain-containing protein [Rhodobacteraceae bacterium]|nr:cyclic nucleotide-binding domain-containing protein [Paracoccaceae bacterium]
MTGWTARAPALAGLDAAARARLDALHPQAVPKGATIFRAGELAQGFALVLSGRIEVFATGAAGREILLYAVAPGQSCMQTTLSLLGGESYTGDASAASDCEVVAIPRPLFLTLMDDAPGFRTFVFTAFGQRMREMVALLSTLAFQRLESRLAALLLARAEAGLVSATHQDLAAALGSAREVISRRLDGFARHGWVATTRGQVRLLEPAALRAIAEAPRET